MSNLIKFYTDILKFANLKIGDDGTIYADSVGKRYPILIEDKELVLPTQENLRSPDIMNKTVFHPIPENIGRTESPIIQKLSSIINIRLNLTAAQILLTFIKFAHSPTEQHKLNPDQSEIVSKMGSVDKTGFDNLTKVIKKGLSSQTDRFLTNIFLKKGGELKVGDAASGKRYARLGVVTFPLLDMLKTTNELFGVKLREKDVKSLISMIEAIYPDCNIKNYYSKGSDNDFIPYLEALLMSSLALASRQNDIIDLFEEHINDDFTTRYDTSFFDDMVNIDSIIAEARRIPVQAGNVAPAIAAHQQAAVAAQPQPVPVASATNDDNTVDFNKVMSTMPALAMNAMNVPNPYMPMGQMPMMPMQMGRNAPPNWLSNYQPQMPVMPMGQMPMMPMQNAYGFPVVNNQQPMPVAPGRAPF